MDADLRTLSLEPVINIRVGGVPPHHAKIACWGPGVADENRARRGGIPPRRTVAGPTAEDDNEVWPDLRRNPSGWGQFSPFLRHSLLEDTPYSSLLVPRNEKNWLPAPPAGKLITGSRAGARRPQASTGQRHRCCFCIPFHQACPDWARGAMPWREFRLERSRRDCGLPTSSVCGILHRSVTPAEKVSPENMLFRIAARLNECTAQKQRGGWVKRT